VRSGSQGFQGSQGQPLWTVAVTATFLACSQRQVHRLISRGDLPAKRIGRSRLIRIVPADVDRLLHTVENIDTGDLDDFISETTA